MAKHLGGGSATDLVSAEVYRRGYGFIGGAQGTGKFFRVKQAQEFALGQRLHVTFRVPRARLNAAVRCKGDQEGTMEPDSASLGSAPGLYLQVVRRKSSHNCAWPPFRRKFALYSPSGHNAQSMCSLHLRKVANGDTKLTNSPMFHGVDYEYIHCKCHRS